MNVILKRFNVKELVSNLLSKISSFTKEKILDTSVFTKIQEFVINNKLAVKITSYVLSIVLVVLLAATVTGVRLAFNVEYNGKVIATVAGQDVSRDAISIAQKTLSKDLTKFLSAPKLTLTLSFDERLDTANEAANKMISSTDEIVMTSALVVDGEYKGFAQNSDLTILLNQRLNEYTQGNDCVSQFVENIEIKEGYYLASDVANGTDVTESISALTVRTTFTKITKEKIPYTIKEVSMPSKSVGYRQVTTVGKNGVSQKSVQIEMLNGKVLKKTLLSETVVTEPVEQVVTVGTGKKYISKNENTIVSNSGFICPLAKGSFVISSYWGDGRNHKAMDFAASYGTPIYASAGGKVVYAGWANDYGYNIIIDHGNGLRTRYAHASKLYVSQGQTVDRGQTIAAVGSTGNSTGNHLHFEVIVNGTRVNPAPYIGL